MGTYQENMQKEYLYYCRKFHFRFRRLNPKKFTESGKYSKSKYAKNTVERWNRELSMLNGRCSAIWNKSLEMGIKLNHSKLGE